MTNLQAGALPGAYQQYGADCAGARDAASEFIASKCSKMSVSFRSKNGKYAVCTDAYDQCAVHRAPTTAQPKVVGIECSPITNGNALIAFTYKFSH